MRYHKAVMPCSKLHVMHSIGLRSFVKTLLGLVGNLLVEKSLLFFLQNSIHKSHRQQLQPTYNGTLVPRAGCHL